MALIITQDQSKTVQLSKQAMFVRLTTTGTEMQCYCDRQSG